MLHVILVLAVVCTVGIAMPLPDFYSYSPEVGGGSGVMYSSAYEGRITGIRIWEYASAYIGGIQLQYNSNWTDLICASYGTPMEMTLSDSEFIIEVSGKSEYYIYEILFVTNRGRIFKVGQPYGTSFNFFPTHDGSELRFISGRHDGYGVTSIGAHWAVYNTDSSVTP